METVEQNDIVYLNVGGQKMSTTRSTLCQVEGSLLASMFSGNWKDNLVRDKDGCVFLDFNPDFFSLILNYLRMKKIESTLNTIIVPKVSRDKTKNFNIFLEYLGLTELLNEFFEEHSYGISVYGDCAMHSENGSGYHYVLGGISYNKGIINWKLKIDGLKNNDKMYVGILENGTIPSGTTSFNWPGSYGWILGATGFVCTNTTQIKDDSLNYLTKQGDNMELTFDCGTSTLTLFTGGQHFHQNLPSSKTWRLNICLFGANDAITIV